MKNFRNVVDISGFYGKIISICKGIAEAKQRRTGQREGNR